MRTFSIKTLALLEGKESRTYYGATAEFKFRDSAKDAKEPKNYQYFSLEAVN